MHHKYPPSSQYHPPIPTRLPEVSFPAHCHSTPTAHPLHRRLPVSEFPAHDTPASAPEEVSRYPCCSNAPKATPADSIKTHWQQSRIPRQQAPEPPSPRQPNRLSPQEIGPRSSCCHNDNSPHFGSATFPFFDTRNCFFLSPLKVLTTPDKSSRFSAAADTPPLKSAPG